MVPGEDNRPGYSTVSNYIAVTNFVQIGRVVQEGSLKTYYRSCCCHSLHGVTLCMSPTTYFSRQSRACVHR